MSQNIEFFSLFYCLIGSVMVSIICHKFEFIYFARVYICHQTFSLFLLLNSLLVYVTKFLTCIYHQDFEFVYVTKLLSLYMSARI